MITLIFIALIYFTLYVLVVQMLCFKKKKRFLNSLSESYYILEDTKKNSGIVFMISLMFILPSLIVPMMEVTPNNYGVIPLVAIFGLALVGAAPLFKTHDKITHSVGAIVAAVFGFIWSVLTKTWGMWLIDLALVLEVFGIHVLYKRTYLLKNAITFWLEMIAFYGLFLGLIWLYRA